jgi:hypothetical protein
MPYHPLAENKFSQLILGNLFMACQAGSNRLPVHLEQVSRPVCALIRNRNFYQIFSG